ncbi:MAG: GPW/gp25 family protein [Desulfovibrio sp.]|jgi:phage baseplate assembly protein W|nr:GPW/gp25 family protein [Desulfovibrio sp.]
MEMLVVDAAPIVIGATGMESLLQNIRIIIQTTMYSVPLDRGFAHVGDALDSPSPHMTALLVSKLIDAIELKEPRVTVESITLEPVDSLQGRFAPRVVFHPKEGVAL